MVALPLAAGERLLMRFERVPFTPLHTRVMTLLGLGTFLDSFDLLAIGSALTVIFRTLGIDFVDTGLLISLAFVGQIIGAVLFGIVSEVKGRKIAFIWALVVMGLFSLASAFAWNFQSLAWARALLGIGLGGEAPIAGAMMAELLQRRRRGAYFLVYQSLFQWGSLLTPFIGLGLIRFLGPELGWRCLLGLGAAPLLIALIAARALPESVRWLVGKGRVGEAETVVAAFEQSAARSGRALPAPEIRAAGAMQRTRFAELFEAQYVRRTTLCWLNWFCTYIVVAGVVTWLPTVFVRLGHLSPSESLMAAVVVNSLALVTCYAGAGLADIIGRRMLFVIGYVGMGAGAVIGLVEVGVFELQGWVPYFVAALVLDAFLVINATACYLYTAELYPTRMRAWGTSSGRAVSLIASVIGPLSVGKFLASSLGAGGMFGMFLLASVLGLGVILGLGIETKGRALEEIST
jgi:MFS transporter, putative metabolite:H+ symporter